MKKLKIATMATAQVPIPIPNGRIMTPSEMAINIANGLSKLGHQVYFFTTSDSENKDYDFNLIKANFESTLALGKRSNKEEGISKLASFFNQELLLFLYKNNKKLDFDLIILHDPFFKNFFPIVKMFPNTPVLMVVHCGMSSLFQKEIHRYYKLNHAKLVPISYMEKEQCPDLNWTKVIYNGIDVESYPFKKTKKDYLFFAGRISADKGVAQATEIAKKSNHELLIAGEIRDGEYYSKFIKPNLSNKIKFLGFLDKNQIKDYYKNAKALIAPIQWDEPFGLTYVEAMACGTPVITFNKGAANEVVKNNETGIIVSKKEEMIEAVKEIKKIIPDKCRKRVEDYFSSDRMIKEYEEICYRALGLSK